MPEPQTSYANGSFTKATSVAGSNNITPIMQDTLGVIVLAIISLVLFCEVRRLNNLNRDLAKRLYEAGRISEAGGK